LKRTAEADFCRVHRLPLEINKNLIARHRNLWKFDYFRNMTATVNDRMRQAPTFIKKPETTAQLVRRLVTAYYAKKGIPLSELNKP